MCFVPCQNNWSQVCFRGDASSGGLLCMNLFFWLQQHHWIIHQISLGHFDLLMTATAAYWQVSIQGKHCQPVCLLDCVSLTCRDRLENWYRSRFDGILFYSTLCLGTSFVIIDRFVRFDHFAFDIWSFSCFGS